jgi:hypothetical protein
MPAADPLAASFQALRLNELSAFLRRHQARPHSGRTNIFKKIQDIEINLPLLLRFTNFSL